MSGRRRAVGGTAGRRRPRLRPHHPAGQAIRRDRKEAPQLKARPRQWMGFLEFFMSFDVVTFGEAMIRLAPPQFRRLEQAQSLEVQVGGAELNTAVGVARLGRKAAWVSRLTRNPLGRLIANKAREAGVGTDHIVWTDDDRVGIYFVEFGAAPRASSVLYDRKGSAIAAIQPGMVQWKAAFASAKWFHVTGITPALGTGAAEATREALQA